VNTSGENNLPKRHGIVTARTPDRPKKHSILPIGGTTTTTTTTTPTPMRSRHTSFDATADDDIELELALPLPSPSRTPLALSNQSNHRHHHGLVSNSNVASQTHSFNTMLRSPVRHTNTHSSSTSSMSIQTTPIEGRSTGHTNNNSMFHRSPISGSSRSSGLTTTHHSLSSPASSIRFTNNNNSVNNHPHNNNVGVAVPSSPQLNTGRNLQSDKMFRNSLHGNMSLSPMSPHTATTTTTSNSSREINYLPGLPSPVTITSDLPVLNEANMISGLNLNTTTIGGMSPVSASNNNNNSAQRKYVKPRSVKPARLSDLSTYNGILSSEEFSHASSSGTSLVSSHHSAFKTRN
jgi:hypothetical protein